MTFHFGDLFWVEHLLRQLHRYPDARIREVWIVDQSRSDGTALASLSGVNRILAFPPDVEEIERLGHDHPAALTRVLSEEFSTSHVLVLDSDCFPVRSGWLDGMPPVCLAGDPRVVGLSHPCFNLLPTDGLRLLDYRRGMSELGFDTGRLIGLQLTELGRQPEIMKPAGWAFGGRRGSHYRDGSIYHHGSASFVASPEIRLRRQVHLETELVMRRCVAEGRFQLRLSDRLAISIRSRLRRRRHAEP